MEWDIELKGSFNLKVKQQNEITNPLVNNFWQQKDIQFNIPINIPVWFIVDPKLDPGNFVDFNVGTAIIGGWVITSESHLVEYFENSFWKYLKPMVATGYDVANSILGYTLANQGMEYTDDENRIVDDKLLVNDNFMLSNWISDIVLFQERSLNRILEFNLDNLWMRFDTFMTLYFLDYMRQYDAEYDFFNFTDKPQFPFVEFLPWISVLGYEVTLFYNTELNVLEIKFNHPNGHILLQFHGYNTTKEQLRIVLQTHLTQDGIIDLTTTVASSADEGVKEKPDIFVDGVLYDEYTISTRTYRKPEFNDGLPVVGTDSTEQLLTTRAKFGTLYPVTSMELSELSLISGSEEFSVEIGLILPEEQKGFAAELKQLVDEIATNMVTQPTTTGTDTYIQNRVFISQSLDVFSDRLSSWLNDKSNVKLAIDFSVSSIESMPLQNITIYLTEPVSRDKFISWLSLYSLEFIMVLVNSGNLQVKLSELLTRENQYLSLADIEKLDFEIYSKKLEHELQNTMGIGDNLMDVYEFQNDVKQNLTLLTVLSGTAMNELANGITVPTSSGSNGNGNENLKTNTVTYAQIFYCYQTQDTDVVRTHLLLGTNILY
jgi:hypothetical protein